MSRKKTILVPAVLAFAPAAANAQSKAPVDNDFLVALQTTLDNVGVIFAVVIRVVGPILGIFGLRLHEEWLESNTRRTARFTAAGLLLPFCGLPAVMLGQLITNPRLSLVTHRDQAELGLLIGLLVLIGGGVALAIESRRRRAKGRIKPSARRRPSTS
jgi:hypothetical protein